MKIQLRGPCVLVSTDVAAMGLDTEDLNLSVNIGIDQIKTKHIFE